MRKGLVVAAVVGLGSLACLQTGPASTATANVSNAVLRGDIGYVRGIDRADEVVSRDYGSFTELEIHTTQSASQNAMVLLALNGGLSYWANAGERTITHDGYGQDLSVTGCAGPERDNWDYDETADETDVRVMAAERPNTYRMIFTSRWFGNGRAMPPTQTATGQFDFVVDGPAPAAQPTALVVQTGNISGQINGVVLPSRPSNATAMKDAAATTVRLDFTREATALTFMLPQDGVGAALQVTSQGRPVEVTSFEVAANTTNGQAWNVFSATLADGNQVRGSFSVQQ